MLLQKDKVTLHILYLIAEEIIHKDISKYIQCLISNRKELDQ